MIWAEGLLLIDLLESHKKWRNLFLLDSFWLRLIASWLRIVVWLVHVTRATQSNIYTDLCGFLIVTPDNVTRWTVIGEGCAKRGLLEMNMCVDMCVCVWAISTLGLVVESSAMSNNIGIQLCYHVIWNVLYVAVLTSRRGLSRILPFVQVKISEGKVFCEWFLLIKRVMR